MILYWMIIEIVDLNDKKEIKIIMSLILKNITDRELDLLEANNVDWLPTDNYKKDKSIIFMNENEYNKAIKLLNGIKTRY